MMKKFMAFYCKINLRKLFLHLLALQRQIDIYLYGYLHRDRLGFAYFNCSIAFEQLHFLSLLHRILNPALYYG